MSILAICLVIFLIVIAWNSWRDEAKELDERTAHIPIIYADDIPNLTKYNWSQFSYGDAAYTLVEVEQLLSELDLCEHNKESWDEEYTTLRLRLLDMDPKTLIAFEG
jgi:hypothetical protein